MHPSYLLDVWLLLTYIERLRTDWVRVCCISSHFASLLEDLLTDNPGMLRLIRMRFLRQIRLLSLHIAVHVLIIIFLLQRGSACYVWSWWISTCYVVVEHFKVYLDKFWRFNRICDHLVLPFKLLVLLFPDRIRYLLTSRMWSLSLILLCLGTCGMSFCYRITCKSYRLLIFCWNLSIFK